MTLQFYWPGLFAKDNSQHNTAYISHKKNFHSFLQITFKNDMQYDVSADNFKETASFQSDSFPFWPCILIGVRKTSQLGVNDKAAARTHAEGPMPIVQPKITSRANWTSICQAKWQKIPKGGVQNISEIYSKLQKQFQNAFLLHLVSGVTSLECLAILPVSATLLHR